VGKIIIVAGLVLIAFGVIWMLAERLGLGRLPGDIVIERGNFRIYLPIATSLIVSVAVSIILWLASRL
jgi:hypothetical protein